MGREKNTIDLYRHMLFVNENETQPPPKWCFVFGLLWNFRVLLLVFFSFAAVYGNTFTELETKLKYTMAAME